MSASSGYEYCIVIADGKVSEPMTSKSHNSVGFLLDEYPGKVTLLHSHTNATPPSAKDFRCLLERNIDRIGVIGYNGDTYFAYIGDGERPSIEEYDFVVNEIAKAVNRDIIQNPSFYDWSIPERNYMAIREQAYRIALTFRWTMEGGRINA